VKIKALTAILTTVLLCAIIANGQGGKMSPAFRDKAQRAFDAILRLPTSIPSAESHEPGWEQRKLDVDKAVDEAKYKARTVKDKQVLALLSASNFLIGAAKERRVLDPDWQLLTDAATQCHAELIAELQPGDLSAAGRKRAAEKTCLKQQDAIVKSWEEPVQASNDISKLHDNYIKSTKEYKASLEKLLALYQASARKSEERLNQSKKLFADGLIFQSDVERSERAFTDANLKVNETQQQIVGADAQIAQVLIEISKPETKAKLAREYKQASARQPTCRNWTLTASRQQHGSTVTFAYKLVCKD
jgi:hypothetical protein